MQKQQEKPMNKSKRHNLQGPLSHIFTAMNTGAWRLVRPQVDFSKCIKCGTCERVCPTNIIDVIKDQEECVVFNFDYCKGCGICANECPTKCMEMVPEGSVE